MGERGAGLPPAFALPGDLVGALFQYQAVLESDRARISPALDRVEITVGVP